VNHPEPEVLIGIPTLNGSDRLRRCLRSIKVNTPPAQPFKVLVVDDCSTPENLQRNKNVVHEFGIEMITHQERYGVARGWNDLTRHTKAPYIILMNDDVEVVPDWYDALVFSLKNNPGAGMIGLTAYQGVNSSNFSPPPVKSYNEAVMQRGDGMFSATGFLFGFRHEQFDMISGFDDGYFLFYEEVDFGIRLLQAGWPSYMLSYPVVIHQGGATTSDTRNVQDPQGVMAASRDRFMSKFGGMRAIRDAIDKIWKHRGPSRLVQWNTMLKTWVD
jgi:N-acetylglucosaminyl-diphospho-decaprenol L-rhamnosyltransferase